jgi:hypothetical protein
MPLRSLYLAAVLVLSAMSLASCGGPARGDSVVKIEGPSFEPERIAIRTLEPGPEPTPTPSPTPTPKPTSPPPGVPAPRVATVRSAAGTQVGDPGSYCWSEQVGGPPKCYTNDSPSQASNLVVKQKEKVLLSLDAQIPPNDESIRPFQGTRSGFPDQQIDPAVETELTIDLPKGEWSMDLCATWHGRGQPICWLFKLDVR